MTVGDLLRALPFVVLIGGLPGVGVMTLLGPRLSWAERLAAAPGFSVAVIGATGLLLRLVHLPFEPATVIPILAALVAAGAARWVRTARRLPARSGPGWAVTVVALATGLVAVGVAFTSLGGGVLPPANDPAFHGEVAAAIVRSHDVLPLIPVPADGSGIVRPHAAFEAADALLAQLGAGSPAQTMVPLALLSLLALPLGVSVLAHEALGDRRVSAIAAALSLGLIFPAWPVGYGDYPYLVDSTLIVPLVLAVSRCLEGRTERLSAAIAGAAVCGMWMIHGLEIPTAAVVGAPLWLSTLYRRRSRALRPLLLSGLAVAAGALAGHLLTRPPTIPPLHPSGPAVPDAALGYLDRLHGTGLSALGPLLNLDLSVLTGALLCVGVLVLLLRRRGRWMIGSLLLPALIVADVTGPQLLHPIWERVYPWIVLDRLYGMEYFVAPVVIAAGLAGLGDLWVRASARGSTARSVGARRWASAAMAVVAAAGLLVGAQRSSGMLGTIVGQSVSFTSQDVTVMRELAAHLPADARVLNDGMNDAGEWISAVTLDVEAEPIGYSNVYVRDWRMTALSAACSDPGRAAQALRGFQGVFVGSHAVAGSSLPWKAACIARLPGVRLVAGSVTGAAGFVVTG